MLWLANRAKTFRVDLHTHEQLLRGRGVKEIPKLCSVAYAVDTGLFGFHLPWIVPHALVVQPDASRGRAAILREVDSPSQAGERVGNNHRARTDQATAIQRTRFLRKIEDFLRLNGTAGLPVAQVDAITTRFVIGVNIRRGQVEDNGLNLNQVQRQLLKGMQKDWLYRFRGCGWRYIPQFLVIRRRHECRIVGAQRKVFQEVIRPE